MANASTIAMIEAKHLLRAAGLSCRAIARRLSIGAPPPTAASAHSRPCSRWFQPSDRRPLAAASGSTLDSLAQPQAGSEVAADTPSNPRIALFVGTTSVRPIAMTPAVRSDFVST